MKFRYNIEKLVGEFPLQSRELIVALIQKRLRISHMTYYRKVKSTIDQVGDKYTFSDSDLTTIVNCFNHELLNSGKEIVLEDLFRKELLTKT